MPPLTIIAVLGATFILGPAAEATAAKPPARHAAIKLSVIPSSGKLTVGVSTKGFARCSLRVNAKKRGATFPETQTNAKGKATFRWAVPMDAPSGSWTFTVRCTKAGKAQMAKTKALIVTRGNGKGRLIEPSSLKITDAAGLGGKGGGGTPCAKDQDGKPVCFPFPRQPLQ